MNTSTSQAAAPLWLVSFDAHDPAAAELARRWAKLLTDAGFPARTAVDPHGNHTVIPDHDTPWRAAA